MSALFPPLNVSVTGHGTRTLVFGNGFGTVASIWTPIVEALAADHRVVTFDMAGSGRAERAWQASRHVRLEGFAEDLIHIIEGLDAEKITYIGHSLAGMVGVVAACAEPALFERMILIGASARYLDDPAAHYVGGMSSDAVEQILAAISQDYAAWANGFSQLMMGHADQPGLATGFAHTLKALRPDIALAGMEMILHADRRADCKELGALGIPTLVLQTRQDAAVPQSASHWLADALHAQWTELDLEGHFPHLVNPSLVASRIRAFLG